MTDRLGIPCILFCSNPYRQALMNVDTIWIKTAGDYVMTETLTHQVLENMGCSLWAQNLSHIAQMISH